MGWFEEERKRSEERERSYIASAGWTDIVLKKGGSYGVKKKVQTYPSVERYFCSNLVISCAMLESGFFLTVSFTAPRISQRFTSAPLSVMFFATLRRAPSSEPAILRKVSKLERI